jgi:SulP family sulfate permease
VSPAARLAPPWMRRYRRSWLGPDVVAGLTTAAVVVPSAMAYASLAGLTPEAGLYTSLAALALYALLGSSPVLSVSVTSTLGIMTADAVALAVPDGGGEALGEAAATLGLLTGVVLLAAAVLRLGFMTTFISTPVLVGFKAGMGLWIASSQLGKVLGIPFESGGFVHNLEEAVESLGDVQGPTVALAATTVATMLVLARRVTWLPAALVAVVGGIAAQVLLDLDDHGVALVDRIPAGLPVPDLPALEHVGVLLPAALGIALMSGIESTSAARAFAPAGAPRIDVDREWAALGVANTGAALLQGLPSGGGTSQTAVNARAGARSQISQLTAALVVVLALTLLTAVFAELAQATLGAIVLVAATGLVKPAEFRRIRRVRARDATLAMAAFAAVLLLGALEGILVAVLVSMLTLLHEANHPSVDVVDEGGEGLLVVRPLGSLYFANAARVHDRILELVAAVDPQPEVVVIDGRAMPDIEYTGLEELRALADELGRRGIELWASDLNERPLAMLRDHRPERRVFATLADAVAARAALPPRGSREVDVT